MKKTVVDQGLLHLLVSVYNQSIQTYFYFPDVIIYGSHRMEPEDFELLLSRAFVQPYDADSFGRWYKLSKQGEDFLLQTLYRRKQKHLSTHLPLQQHQLPFFETC